MVFAQEPAEASDGRWWDDLSDDELITRLQQRGFDVASIVLLIVERDESPEARLAMDRALA